MAIITLADGAERYRLSELVDVDGFAVIAGVKPLTIHAYRKKPDRYHVPEPVAYIGSVPVWTRRQAHQWMAGRPGPGVKWSA